MAGEEAGSAWSAPAIPAEVYEGLDSSDLPATDSPAAAPPAAVEAEQPPAAPQQAAGGAPDTEDSPYIKRLRDEAAEERVRRKVYEEAFDGYDDESKRTILQLARQIVEDPAAAAARMEAIVGNIRANHPGDEADRPMTMRDYEALRKREAEQAQQQAMAASNDSIYRQVRELGEDPGQYGGQLLMLEAHYNHGGDLKAAADALRGIPDKIKKEAVDEFVASRRADASGPRPVPAAGTQPPASPPAEMKDWSDARRAMGERLKAERALL